MLLVGCNEIFVQWITDAFRQATGYGLFFMSLQPAGAFTAGRTILCIVNYFTLCPISFI